MNADMPDIGIIYLKDSFNDSELETLVNELAAHNLRLAAKERSPYINASIDIFVPFLQIMLSPEMVAALSQGLLTNATYDAIKMLLAFVRKKFHHHPICIIQSGKVTEETANIHFVVGNNLLILPIDVDDKKYQYTVDRFLELSASTSPEKTIYSFYSEEKDQIIRKTEEEIIREEYEKWKKDNQHL
ncbi:MAG: hypothetical protein HDT14_01965 [Oscillibacter sp.]|nr:hypothetical protein [Oscillibacter sp.]